MSLYPDILFHFTEKKWLYEILRTTFKVSYAREKIIGPEHDREFAVPMVSFCDLKLSELKGFVDKYGRFGIGLTKKWANRNKLNPVLYVNRNCELMDNLIVGVNGVYEHLKLINNSDDFDNLSKSYHNIMNTYRYIKNYDGELIRRGKSINKNYRFADEREWRYVPRLDTQGVLPFIPIKDIDTKEKKEIHNEKIDHIRLHFKPSDIKYLIVESDKDIADLIQHLDSVKSKFDEKTRRILTSRILTVKQIKKDI